MPPVIPPPENIRAFKTESDFERWLSANHDSATEIWLKIHKKNSGLATITYAEALDVALCWGWIDGLKKSFDAQSFLQRFTPRKARSIWSKMNTQHIARLTEANRMRPSGAEQVARAKADGRWDAAYSGARDIEFPAALLKAINANSKAKATFATLTSQNRYAMAFRLGNVKTEATRARKIGEYVAMLARGETLHPNGAVSGTAKKSAKKFVKKTTKKTT